MKGGFGAGCSVAPRQRLSAEVRRGQLVAAAAALVLEQGYLPLPLEALAARVGVSKGLIYGYFLTQHDLFNAVLAEAFEALAAEGIVDAVEQPLEQAAASGAEIYMRHVAARGPVAQYIVRDVFMKGHLRPDLAAFRGRIFRALALRARAELRLPPREALAAVAMAIAIPEETGRLVWQGDLALERGVDLVRQLVGSTLTALRPV